MPTGGTATNLPVFQPFSLDRYLQPVLIYDKEYREQENALSELKTKASALGKVIDKAIDPELYAQYQDYINKVKTQSDAIAAHGLNPGSRRAMMDLKSLYAEDIEPIKKAQELKEEDIKSQREYYIKSGGKVRYSQDANNISLSKYLKGQRPSYNVANLDDIYKESAAGAQAISKRYFTKPQIESLNKQYLLYTQQMGMSSARALEELEKKNSEFGKFAQSMRDRYKYSSFRAGDQTDMDASIRGGILTGLVNEVNYKPIEDKSYTSPAEQARIDIARSELRMKQEEHDATMEAAGYEKKNNKWVRTGNGSSTGGSSFPLSGTINGHKAVSGTIDKGGMVHAYDEAGSQIGVITKEQASRFAVGAPITGSGNKGGSSRVTISKQTTKMTADGNYSVINPEDLVNANHWWNSGPSGLRDISSADLTQAAQIVTKDTGNNSIASRIRRQVNSPEEIEYYDWMIDEDGTVYKTPRDIKIGASPNEGEEDAEDVH